MFPKLLELHLFGHPVIIGSYGVTMSAGYLTALAVIYRRSGRVGMDQDSMLDLLFWILVSSILGSRILYVALNPSGFLGNPLSVVAFWQGGFVFYGGVVAALVAGAVVVWKKGIHFFKAADAIAPGLSIGHAVGRLGCFGVGCCWGKQSSGTVFAKFPQGSVAFEDLQAAGALGAKATETMPLHPVQLYESLGEVLIFLGLLYLGKKKPFHGAVLLVYLIAYGTLRFITEVFRGDPTRQYLFEASTPRFNTWLGLSPEASSFFSTSQAVSSVLVPLAAATLAYFFLKAKKKQSPPTPSQQRPIK